MVKMSEQPTREEDLVRLKELQQEEPTTWQEAMKQSMEIDNIILRAIEWWHTGTLKVY